MKELRVVAFAACAAAYGFALPVSAATTVTVSNVTDLVTALWDHKGETATTVVLARGSYDVSDQAMSGYNADKQRVDPSVSHLSISRLTLRGETDDPRDTVIYGNGTNALFYCYNGAMRHLTLSNGCASISGSCGGGVTSLNTGTVLSNCVITCCSSLGYGGGVHNTKCIDCDLCYNVSTISGGAAYRSNLVGCRVYGNRSGKDGGGAHQTIVVGCTISGNSAANGGGGVSNHNSGKAWTYDSTIVSNTAPSGGGAYNMILSNCTVACNVAANGGGVSYKSVILDSWVTNNIATKDADGCGGGGVYASSSSEAVAVTRCEIAGNFTAGKGGGTYCAIVTNSFIHDNFASTRFGGGCYLGTLVGGVVSNNVSIPATSSEYASGIHKMSEVRGCRLCATSLAPQGEIRDCRICGYTNGWYIAPGANVMTNGWFAGPVKLTSGEFRARNCLFFGNRVGTMFDGSGTTGLSLISCTVAGNVFDYTFENFGNAANGPGYSVDTIYAENANGSGTVRGVWWKPQTMRLAFTNCLFGAASASQSYLSYVPVDCLSNVVVRFDSANASDPYSLKHSSPARGKGLVQDWMVGANDIRGEGYGRLRDEKGTGVPTVDIGCYQCWLDPLGLMLLLR